MGLIWYCQDIIEVVIFVIELDSANKKISNKVHQYTGSSTRIKMHKKQ